MNSYSQINKELLHCFYLFKTLSMKESKDILLGPLFSMLAVLRLKDMKEE